MSQHLQANTINTLGIQAKNSIKTISSLTIVPSYLIIEVPAAVVRSIAWSSDLEICPPFVAVATFTIALHLRSVQFANLIIYLFVQ